MLQLVLLKTAVVSVLALASCGLGKTIRCHLARFHVLVRPMTLPQSLKEQILEHAKAEHPKCCGLVCVIKGRKRWFPCRNLAGTPDEHFVMDPVTTPTLRIKAKCSRHSLTSNDESKAIRADLVACEKTGVPACRQPTDEEWGYYGIRCELPYVGRVFSHGVLIVTAFAVTGTKGSGACS